MTLQACLEFYSTYRQNSKGYTYIFVVKVSSSGASDFVGRRCARLEIQDGSHITGSTNNFADFTDTHVAPKQYMGLWGL